MTNSERVVAGSLQQVKIASSNVDKDKRSGHQPFFKMLLYFKRSLTLLIILNTSQLMLLIAKTASA